MPIRILRKTGSGVTWVANARFKKEFPSDEVEFIIPSLDWMIDLHKDFELIEATDDTTGEQLDLSNVRSCCSEALKLRLMLVNGKRVIAPELDNDDNKDDNFIDNDNNIHKE